MKRVFKLLGLVLAVVVALKLNDIYHNAYPKFKSEACVECQELTEAPNGKTVNLFFRDTMSEGWFQVRDISQAKYLGSKKVDRARLRL